MFNGACKFLVKYNNFWERTRVKYVKLSGVSWQNFAFFSLSGKCSFSWFFVRFIRNIAAFRFLRLIAYQLWLLLSLEGRLAGLFLPNLNKIICRFFSSPHGAVSTEELNSFLFIFFVWVFFRTLSDLFFLHTLFLACGFALRSFAFIASHLLFHPPPLSLSLDRSLKHKQNPIHLLWEKDFNIRILISNLYRKNNKL